MVSELFPCYYHYYHHFLGSCLLPWLPILCGIIFVLVLVSFCLIFSCLCLYCHSCRKRSADVDGIEATDFRNNKICLSQRDLGDNRRVMTWLSNVIETLNSDIASSNRPLHDVLTQLSTDLQNRRTQLDGDNDDEIVEKREPIIEDMIERLKQILTLE